MLNIKKIESLLKQIENAAVVVVDDSPYLHSCDIEDIKNVSEDEPILTFKWDTGEYVYQVEFNQKNLHHSTLSGNEIFLCDVAGNASHIKLYALEPDVIVKEWEGNETI